MVASLNRHPESSPYRLGLRSVGWAVVILAALVMWGGVGVAIDALLHHQPRRPTRRRGPHPTSIADEAEQWLRQQV